MLVIVILIIIKLIIMIMMMIRYLMWTSPSTVWQTRTSNQTRSYISSLSASLGKIIIIVVLVIIIIIIIIKLDCELYLWVSGHYSVRSANVSVVIKVIILIIILLIRSVPAAWLIFTLIVLLIYLLTRCHLHHVYLPHDDMMIFTLISDHSWPWWWRWKDMMMNL